MIKEAAVHNDSVCGQIPESCSGCQGCKWLVKGQMTIHSYAAHEQINSAVGSYFIFILPDTYPNHGKAIIPFRLLQIYYFFFSLQKQKFLDKKRINVVSDFRIEGSEINFSKINYLFNKAISDINDSKRIFESSKKNSLKEKSLKKK